MENENKSIQEMRQRIQDMATQLNNLQQIVNTYIPSEQNEHRARAAEIGSMGGNHRGTLVEGVFDGQHMVGPDGKNYTIPPNYASKSKLVEGDILKLTIQSDGTFIYKQIGPVQRDRKVGTLVRDENGNYFVSCSDGRSYKLLSASVTYFKGEIGDSVVILIPTHMSSRWAAVENMLKTDDVSAELEDGSKYLLENGDDAELASGDEEM